MELKKHIDFKDMLKIIGLLIFILIFSDTPLAKIAQNSYIVKRDKIIEWDKYKPSNISMIFTTFLNREFIYSMWDYKCF